MTEPTWKGKLLSSKNDSSEKYVSFLKSESFLSIPVVIEKNTTYEITIKMKCDEGGGGDFWCEIFGNEIFAFKGNKIECKNTNWKEYNVFIHTSYYSDDMPFKLLLTRGNFPGELHVKNLSIEKKDFSTNDDSIELEFEKFKNNPYIKFFEKPESKCKKVLYIPFNSAQIKQTGTEDAFVENEIFLCSFDFVACERNIGTVEMNKLLLNLAICFKPDWIHMQRQFGEGIELSTIKQIKSQLPHVFITNWSGDIRNEAIKCYIECSKEIDLSLLSSVGQLNYYRENGCKNIEYWQIGYDPKFFYRKTDEERNSLNKIYNHDIVFCANFSHSDLKFPGSQLRADIISLFHDEFGSNFAAYGTGYKHSKGHLNFFKQNDVYNAAKIVISVNHFNDVEMYFSDRQLVSMASGTLTISKYIPGLERYFENKKDLVWFNTKEEALELAKYYLSHPEEAEEIGRNGAKKVLEEHTFYCRVKELYERIFLKKSIDMTVLIGTYNRLPYLKDSVSMALNSIGNRSVEVIVSDAGSTDGTIEWLKEMASKDNRITLMLTGKKTSFTQAYNDMIKIAKGKYITYLSDDMFSIGNGLEIMCDLMDTLDEKDMGAFKVKNYPTEDFHHFYYADKPCPIVGCMCAKTFRNYQGFNVDYLHYAQDLEICAKIYRMGGKIVQGDSCVLHAYVHDEFKNENSKKYEALGKIDKFSLMYTKFGKSTGQLYPRVCLNVKEKVAPQRIENLYNHISQYYSKIEVFVVSDEPYKIYNVSYINPKDYDEEMFDLIMDVYNTRSSISYPKNKQTQFSNQLCK